MISEVPSFFSVNSLFRLKAAAVFFTLIAFLSVNCEAKADPEGRIPNQEIDEIALELLPEAKRFIDLVEITNNESGSEQLTHEDHVNGKNVPADTKWKWARLLAAGAAYTIYLWGHEEVDIGRSLTMGLVGGGLSWGFQHFTPQYVRWISQKGFLNLSQEKAPFWEVQAKELSLQCLYIGIFHLAAFRMGIEDSLITKNLLMTVFWSWAAEGSWSVLIARTTDHLRLNRYKDHPRFAWHLGKASFFGLALLSSMLMISGLHGDIFTKIAYPVMAISGFTSYFWFIERERLGRAKHSCADKLSRLLKRQRRT